MTSELRQRIIDTLSWMVTDMKHRFDEQKSIFGQRSEGGYSAELTEAIDLLKELKNNDNRN